MFLYRGAPFYNAVRDDCRVKQHFDCSVQYFISRRRFLYAQMRMLFAKFNIVSSENRY